MAAAAAAMCLSTFGLGATAPASAADIAIGTGSTSGVYFQLGRAICRTLRRGGSKLSCETLSTPGSVHNLTNVAGNALDLGVVQSDIHYNAINKTGRMKFLDVDFSNIRSVFAGHDEAFTLIARRDSGILSVADLPGKRVNIGNPGSGQRATMEVVMKAMGWTQQTFQVAEQFTAAEHSLALCHNRVQAIVYMVGHPNASVGKAVALCSAMVVPVTGDPFTKLISENPYYAVSEIPGGVYEGSMQPIETFGVKATIVTSSDVSDDIVYEITKQVFDNLRDFRRMHPALGYLDPKEMRREGLAAPLHPGAERYYREKGLY